MQAASAAPARIEGKYIMKQSYKIFTAALLASMSLAAAAQADDFADA